MWHRLGRVDPESLTQARLQAHWAAQVVSALGTTRLPAASDSSHTNLGWDPTRAVLVGRPIEDGRAAGLRLSTLTLELGDDVYPLDGHTLAEAMTWLAEHTGGRVLTRPEHELPAHAVGEGGRFSLGDAAPALAELEAWFANANGALEAFAARTEGASRVRCWPHHFDIATLVAIEGTGEEAKSVGVGLSPGDGSYDQPYIYVTPWPYPSDPEPEKLPPLPGGGRWHTQGWFGAVLPGRALVASSDQERASDRFIADATAACRGMLED